MQGGNVPGGLGLDKEFFESILVPQVMLYGFLGFRPTVDGCEIAPHLPGNWPSLTITRIHLHDHVIDVSVQGKEITLMDHTPGGNAFGVKTPPGWSVKRSEQ
jgi:hypothetical protein